MAYKRHMGPTHPEWAAFCAALAAEVDLTEDEEGKLSWHCQNDHRRTHCKVENWSLKSWCRTVGKCARICFGDLRTGSSNQLRDPRLKKSAGND